MKTLILASALFLVACPPLPNPAPMPPDADSAAPLPAPRFDASRDAAFVPVSGSACAQSCAVLQFVGCEEGNATPKGEPCDSVCSTAQGFPGLSLPTACVAKARSIDEVRRCGVRCSVK